MLIFYVKCCVKVEVRLQLKYSSLPELINFVNQHETNQFDSCLYRNGHVDL